MSFKSLNKSELKDAAEAFAVDISDDATKDEIIAELADNGVTWDQYKAFSESDEEDEAAEATEATEAPEAKEEVEGNTCLVKMTRPNASYQIRGYTFTAKHPFVEVTEDDADYLVSDHGGFKIATPKEVREFYK